MTECHLCLAGLIRCCELYLCDELLLRWQSTTSASAKLLRRLDEPPLLTLHPDSRCAGPLVPACRAMTQERADKFRKGKTRQTAIPHSQIARTQIVVALLPRCTVTVVGYKLANYLTLPQNMPPPVALLLRSKI